MTVLNFKQGTIAPTTNGGINRKEYLIDTPITSVTQPEKLESFSLDEFVASLATANPQFGRIFEEQGKALSALATTNDGGVTLTSLRMASGLTQTQLAQKVGQRQSNISLMESGQRANISRDSMKKFCDALGTDMNTLDIALDNSRIMFDQYIESQENAIKVNLGRNEAA